jgi:methionyl-tRNA formyltransferase
MLSVCLLISGNLGFNILTKLLNDNSVSLVAVFTDEKSLEISALCKDNNISKFIGNPRNGKAKDFLKEIKCEVLLSVNYLYIIEKDLIDLPIRYAINVHGSLLPKYRGRTPHVWAIINGERETGITAHLINEDVDNGAIVHQQTIPILDDDTGAIILEKYNNEYPNLISVILSKIKESNLTAVNQDCSKATYFGKRTPEDGRIVWDWTKERIKNWIRAQAKPYPGAFFFLEDNKISVHKSSFHEIGFNYRDQNGKVLLVTNDTVVVKTPNGAISLEKLEGEGFIKIKKGVILS